jgi:hypothetical protein
MQQSSFEPLEKMVKKLDNRFRYTLKVGESSWLNKKVNDFLKVSKIYSTTKIQG